MYRSKRSFRDDNNLHIGAGWSHCLAGKTIFKMYLMVRVHLAAECDITITNGAWSQIMTAWCFLIIASFPGLPTIQFLQYWLSCKRSKTGWWEGVGMRLPLVMVIWFICLGIFWWCSVRTNYLLDLSQRSEVWVSCNFLNEHSWTLLIGIPKANSRCSSLPSVAEVPYMEGFICKQKLHVAVERTAWS